MAHGRKFRTTRRIPDSERSLFEQKLSGRYSRTLDRTDLLALIKGGEDTYLEFKIRLVNIEKITAEVVAMANSGGGAILFGVNDQRRVEGLDDPEQVEEQIIDICRNHIRPALLPRIDKVSFDNGTRIVVLQVDDRRAPHSTLDNRYFIRIGSTKREADGNEIAHLFGRFHTTHFEDLPVVTCRVEDIDEALVWSFIRDAEGETFREPAGFPTADALRDLGLGVSYGGLITPTLAGLLLFGRIESIEKAVPHSSLSVSRFSGSSTASPVIEHRKLSGNLAGLYDGAMSFINRYVDVWETRPPRSALLHNQAESPIQARANFPKDVVSEALINLLVHRNYSMVGGESRILIFDDRIEFINPIRSTEVTKKLVEYGVANRQNPRIHKVFTSREYGIGQIQRGVPGLRRSHYTFSRKEAKISLLGDEFRLELAGI